MGTDAGYPEPPAGSGLTCAARAGGNLLVDGGTARFEVSADALRVSWDSLWAGEQHRSVARAEVRQVSVAPDTASANRRQTAQLVIHLADGPPIVPLRRRGPAEVEWVAARLREALRAERPDWSVARPTRPLPAPASARPPGGPQPVKPIWNTPRVPPRPIHNGSVRRARGAVMIRLRPARWWGTHREAYPVFAVSALAGVLGIVFLLAAAGGAGPQFLLWLFGGIGVVLGCFNVWAARHIAVVAGTSHVLRLSPRGLFVASISRLKRERQFVPRAEIAAAAVGQTDDETPTAELHLYLADGSRIPLLTGRPTTELKWLADQVALALPDVAPAPACPGEPFGPGGVLPYESRRKRAREIEVRQAADGGVTILIPPAASDRRRHVTWPLPLLVLTHAALCLVWGPGARVFGDAWPGLLVAVLAAAAWVTARGVLLAMRGNAPTVIGVDRAFLYADFPDRFFRRKRWPRASVRDVQLVDTKANGRGTKPEHWVQIVFHDYHPPVHLCAYHTPADRQRLAAILRAALELPGNP